MHGQEGITIMNVAVVPQVGPQGPTGGQGPVGPQGERGPAVYQSVGNFHALIKIDQQFYIQSSSFVVWHANIKLTFTPQTDRVFFTVQLRFKLTNGGGTDVFFGLKKGDDNVSLPYTGTTGTDASNLGGTDELAVLSELGTQDEEYVFYSALLSVTRGAEVTISPTVKIENANDRVSMATNHYAALTAMDVGVYG